MEPTDVHFAASDSLLTESDYEKYPDLQVTSSTRVLYHLWMHVRIRNREMLSGYMVHAVPSQLGCSSSYRLDASKACSLLRTALPSPLTSAVITTCRCSLQWREGLCPFTTSKVGTIICILSASIASIRELVDSGIRIVVARLHLRCFVLHFLYLGVPSVVSALRLTGIQQYIATCLSILSMVKCASI